MISWKSFLKENKCFHGEVNGKEIYALDTNTLKEYFNLCVLETEKELEKPENNITWKSTRMEDDLIRQRKDILRGVLKVYKELAEGVN